MSGQPKDMNELVLSIGETMGEGEHHVIPTIVSRHADQLGGNSRAIANTMLLHARMLHVGLTAGTPPESQFSLLAQTDAYYRDQDPSGNFSRLHGIALNAARGRR